MKQTVTYERIVEGNERYLYESYPANLQDMLEDWKEKNIHVFGQITTDPLDEASRWTASMLD